MWKKFRDCPGALAYCEVYHEFLLEANYGNIAVHGPHSWKTKSHHPDSAPYFLEFTPLLRLESNGIPFMRESMVFTNMLPPAGKPLPSDEEDYLRALVSEGHKQEKTPVLTCTKNLGRAPATRLTFPDGVHIATVRNLWHQWMSFNNQHLQGNNGFLGVIPVVLGKAPSDDPVVAFLLERYGKDLKSPAAGESPSLALFYSFIALHLYLYVRAFSSVDLIVDINRLAEDCRYREDTQARIRELTGLPVDFSDVSCRIEYGPTPVPDSEDLRVHVEAILAVVFSHSGESEIARREVRRIVDELYAEVAKYDFYTKAVLSHCARTESELSNAKQRIAQQDDALRVIQATLAQAEEKSNDMISRALIKDGELGQARHELEQAQEELRQTKFDESLLIDEIARFRRMIHGVSSGTHLYRAWRVLVGDAHYRQTGGRVEIQK